MSRPQSAKKSAQQSETRRQRNASKRSMLKTFIKKALKAITSQADSAAEPAYKQAQSCLDRSATKGLIHKNKAARHKSRLMKKLNLARSTDPVAQ